MKVLKKHRLFIFASTLLVVSATTLFSFISVRGMFPFLPVSGDSMYPSLKHGDLITVDYAWPHNIKPNDIIVFAVSETIQKNYNYLPVIAHRVTEVKKLGNYGTVLSDRGVIDVIPVENYRTIYYTKGDSSGEDSFMVWPQQLKGKINRYYSGLGFPILFFQSKQGLAVVIIALLLLVVYLFWKEILLWLFKFNKQVFKPLILERRQWVGNYRQILGKKKTINQRWGEILLGLLKFNRRVFKVLNLGKRRLVRNHEPIFDKKKISSQLSGSIAIGQEQQAKQLESIQNSLNQFTSVLVGYSETLRVHTNVIKELSRSTKDLRRSAEEYNEANKRLSELLERTLVGERVQPSDYEEKQAQAPTRETQYRVRRTTSAPPGCYFSVSQ